MNILDAVRGLRCDPKKADCRRRLYLLWTQIAGVGGAPATELTYLSKDLMSFLKGDPISVLGIVAAPANVAVAQYYNPPGSLTLTWDSVSGATSYNLWSPTSGVTGRRSRATATGTRSIGCPRDNEKPHETAQVARRPRPRGP